MKTIRNNIAVKTAAYILMLISILCLVGSFAVAGVNFFNQWYSKSSDNVTKDIYEKVAVQMYITLSDALYGENQTHIKNPDIQAELFEGEDDAKEYGYSFYLLGPVDVDDVAKFNEKYDKQYVKEVNKQLKTKDGTYVQSFTAENMYFRYKIGIYLGQLNQEFNSTELPDEINNYYDYNVFAYENRITALIIGGVSLLVTIALFIFLVTSVGREKKEDAFIKKIPMDLLAVVAVFFSFFMMQFGYDINFEGDFYLSVAIAVFVISGISIIGTGYLLMFAARVKQGEWWKGLVIYKAFELCKKILRICMNLIKKIWADFIKKIPLVWKTAIIVAAYIIVNMMTIASWSYFLWFVINVATGVFVVYTALCFKKLKEGGKHLADGDLNFHIDKKGLFMDLSEHADDLNSIGQGMTKAVDEKMKSERFKTELITNVSHDIKTPLTSIINYVDLLQKEGIDSEKSAEYLEVIDRQSQRLKKLTADIVEASKAATGNIKMQLAPCNVGVLMTQVMGEYEEKAEAAGLKLVLDLPDEEENNIMILADGRKMWRIFDNLMNNICKYSQEGTRVYQSLEVKDGRAVIIYRNTSRDELNITGEELTERFVRGDKARNTEGSGLGLSIAKNLTELQDGIFEIKIDGDLFKVAMMFEMM